MSPFIRIVLAAVVATSGAGAQSFEVASVKPADVGATGSTFSFPPGGGIRIVNGTLRQIVETAWYEFRDFQIVGGPAWMNSERFDILATGGPGVAIPDVRKKLQALLAARFALRVHTETRELPMYSLVVAKGGSKVEAAADSGGGGIQSSCGRMVGTKSTMANLAVYLSRYLHRPVEDHSELTGSYNFEFEWTPDDTPCSPPTDGPSLFTALQEKLGLKLETSKDPQDVLVIDGAEKPDAN